VDYVFVFAEDTPHEAIERVLPDVLVKGGDWPKNQIVGRQTVENRGGRVEVIRFEEGYSTTKIIERIRGYGAD
jgi:D-beta-D-heptose 7-phosphate kinase/D-beta-D-heptose 1-phosphate adenosyltransferase